MIKYFYIPPDFVKKFTLEEEVAKCESCLEFTINTLSKIKSGQFLRLINVTFVKQNELDKIYKMYE